MSRVTVTRVNRKSVLRAMLDEEFPVTGKTTLDLAQSIGRAMGTHPSLRGKIHTIVEGLINSGLIIHRDATVRLITDEELEETKKASKRQRAAKHFSRSRRCVYTSPASGFADMPSSKPTHEDEELPEQWSEFAGASPDDPELLKACALVVV